MSEIFKNAPLAQAIFQIRFPGETAVEVARPRIQRDLRTALPKLFVPKAIPDVAPALQAYIFRSDDENDAVEVAISSFGYATKTYDGYSEFRSKALGYASVFSEHVPEVQKLTRVGLRYINRIPILRQSKSASIPLKDYLNVGLTLPTSIPEANLTELNSVFTVRLEGGNLKVLVKNEAGPSLAEQELLVLDFDFAQVDDLQMSRLSDYLDLAHGHTKRVFTDLIAEKYFPVLRGEIQ